MTFRAGRLCNIQLILIQNTSNLKSKAIYTSYSYNLQLRLLLKCTQPGRSICVESYLVYTNWSRFDTIYNQSLNNKKREILKFSTYNIQNLRFTLSSGDVSLYKIFLKTLENLHFCNYMLGIFKHRAGETDRCLVKENSGM